MESSLYLFKTGLLLATLLSAPVLLAVLVVGMLVSLVQAAFQLQDQTLPIVAKLVVAVLVLAMSWSWMSAQLIQFSQQVFDSIQTISVK
ncbi:EscS/YscS/HrcS family type III secretion system export apparatus protein [Variovorax sp. RHLX14]|uniref:EscS/YscS/HrcS family type III secretion system export apparatus protein n=1 Tax=Variovorax sp. RHLX14 TaxID=1259731 RepID=UPI003F46DE12